MPLFPDLANRVASLLAAFDEVQPERRQRLERLSEFVRGKRRGGEPAKLTFICTHNSRRSHMSQLWAAAAAVHYRLNDVRTYSGGTEVTAFDSRAVAAMKRAGFSIDSPEGANPRYQVSFENGVPAHQCFSKLYHDLTNPQREFAAVMTCSSADAACPIVQGAAVRVSLPWDDPKVADDTPDETARYDERCRQIGIEMLYLFSRV